MSESNHTPGPWHITKAASPDGYGMGNIINAQNTAVAVAMPMPSCNANAKLIAAAPALLVALQDYINGVHRLFDLRDDEFTPEEYLSIKAKAKAAIAAATGESQ